MAFPVVESVTPTAFDTDATAHLVAMPATVNSGDLLIIGFSNDGGVATVATPSGWDLLASDVDITGSGVRGSVYYRIANGTEGGTTVDLVTSASEKAAAHVYRYSGWHGTTPPEISALATATGTAPDPATLTPSWGAEDTAWLVFIATDGAVTLSVYPASYTNGSQTISATPNAAGIGSARRALNATSDDPAAGTISASEQWVAYTVAVRPSAGGGSPQSISVGAASETETAKTVSVGGNTVVAVGTASETETAGAVTAATLGELTAFPIRQQISHFLTGTSISAELRVAPLEDNMVFALVSAATTLANLTGPSGYTKAAEEEGDGVSIQLWYKRAGAAESTTVTLASSASVALKIHVWESPEGMFVTGDPLDVVDTNDSSTSAVTTLAAGTTAATSQANTFAIAAVTALGGNEDFMLVGWSDDFTALSDHETRGLAAAYKVMTAAEAATAAATWNQATSPTTHKAAGLVATFSMAAVLTLPVPTPRRVAFGTVRDARNTTGTTDVIAEFPVFEDHLYLAFVGTSRVSVNGADSSISDSHGAAMSWTLHESHFIGTARRVHVFRSLATSTELADSLIIVTPDTTIAIGCLVLDVTGIDLSGTNGSGAIRQVASGDEPVGDTFVEISFASAPLTDNAVVGFLLHGEPERQLVDDDPLHLLFGESNIASQQASVDWFQGSDQTFRWDWASAIHAIGIIAELQIPTDSQSVVVGVASETETAQGITAVPGAVSIAVGVATETETAKAVALDTGAAPQTVAVGAAAETETAQAVTVQTTVTIAVTAATETEAANTVSPTAGAVTVNVGTATETETAQIVEPVLEGGPQSISVAVATELETAKAVTVATTITITVVAAAEVETAHGVTAVPGAVLIAVGMASEIETARPVIVQTVIRPIPFTVTVTDQSPGVTVTDRSRTVEVS